LKHLKRIILRLPYFFVKKFQHPMFFLDYIQLLFNIMQFIMFLWHYTLNLLWFFQRILSLSTFIWINTFIWIFISIFSPKNRCIYLRQKRFFDSMVIIYFPIILEVVYLILDHNSHIVEWYVAKFISKRNFVDCLTLKIVLKELEIFWDRQESFTPLMLELYC